MSAPLPTRPRATLVAVPVAVVAMILAMTVPGSAATTIQSACPDPPASDYVDRDEIAAVHVAAVDCLTARGIVEGYGSGVGVKYLPDAEVPRGQMAAFVARTLAEAGVALPAPQDQGFVDVEDDSIHADAIRQLAQIGVVQGVSADRYAPHRFVTREEMATFLVRAVALEAGLEVADVQGGETPFTDVAADSTHRPSIDGAYQLGITEGVAQDRYAPAQTVRREAMASFVARTLDAMLARAVVADRDSGATAHTTTTFPSEAGRCFQVTAGDAWNAECDPETRDALQLYTVAVGDAFAVVAGLVSDQVTRVEVETTDGASVEVDLVGIGVDALRAFSSPILLADVEAVVAYDGTQEIARTSPDDPAGPPFQADTQPDSGDGSGEVVNVAEIRIAHHQTYDRVVFDMAGDGLPGWEARYVDQAHAQGSGQQIQTEGDATIKLLLNENVEYPPGDDRHAQGYVEGVDALNEVYFGTVYEGTTQIVLGIDSRTPFRVLTLQDPPRLVLDVVHPWDAG